MRLDWILHSVLETGCGTSALRVRISLHHHLSQAAILITILSMVFQGSIVEAQATNSEIDGYVQGQIEEASERVRARLQDEHDSVDYSDLMRFKEAVDSHLSPVFFLVELGRGDVSDIFGVFNYSYADEEWAGHAPGCPDRLEEASPSVSSYRITKDRHVAFQLQTMQHSYHGGSYPAALWMDGALGDEGGWVEFRFYEPYLANRGVDFPFHPENLLVAWQGSIARITQATPAQDPIDRVIVDDESLLFNNPSYVYSLWDSLKISIALNYTSANISGNRGPLLEGCICDAWMSRRSVFVSELHHKIDEIVVRQEPIRLLHYHPVAYSVMLEVGGETLSQGEFLPSGYLEYLEKGRDIRVTFGTPEDERDNESVPERVAIASDQVTFFSAEYTDVRYVNNDPSSGVAPDVNNIDPALREALSRLTDVYQVINTRSVGWEPDYFNEDDTAFTQDSHLLRARLKYNIYAALATDDQGRVIQSLAQYKEMLQRDGLPDEFYIYNVESLGELVAAHMGLQRAVAFLEYALEDAYDSMGPRELLAQMIRLDDQNRLAYAVVASGVLLGKAQPNSSLANFSEAAQSRFYTEAERYFSMSNPHALPWHELRQVQLVQAMREN